MYIRKYHIALHIVEVYLDSSSHGYLDSYRRCRKLRRVHQNEVRKILQCIRHHNARGNRLNGGDGSADGARRRARGAAARAGSGTSGGSADDDDHVLGQQIDGRFAATLAAWCARARRGPR